MYDLFLNEMFDACTVKVKGCYSMGKGQVILCEPCHPEFLWFTYSLACCSLYLEFFLPIERLTILFFKYVS